MKKTLFNKLNAIWLFLIIGLYLVFEIMTRIGMINNVIQTVMLTIGINIMLAMGLNLIIGVTGQFSLGHAGFMAIGAYASGIVILNRGESPLWIGVGMVLGMLISMIAALIIAIPTLRLRGDYLAIATLGFGETIRILIQNIKITNGAAGLVLPKLAGWRLVYILLVITSVILINFTRSAYGRACISIREDEIAADSMGLNTTKFKILAFSLGAIVASLAGSLYAMTFYVIKPNMFSFTKSIDILVTVVFGGMGSYTGSVLAGTLMGIINYFLQSFSDIRMILYGIILVAIMVFRPEGLLGTREFKLSNIIGKKEE